MLKFLNEILAQINQLETLIIHKFLLAMIKILIFHLTELDFIYLV